MNLGSNTAEEGGRPYINGDREQSNNFLLDGVNNNQASDNLLGFTPSPDAIGEVNIITQNASAEFGNYNGGIVNATIKSGADRYHGDVFEFFRNDIFNANKWENGLNNGTPIPGTNARESSRLPSCAGTCRRNSRRSDRQEQAVLLRGLSGWSPRHSLRSCSVVGLNSRRGVGISVRCWR